MGAATLRAAPSRPAPRPPTPTPAEIRRILVAGADDALRELYVTVRHLMLWKRELEGTGRKGGRGRIDAAIQEVETAMVVLRQLGASP